MKRSDVAERTSRTDGRMAHCPARPALARIARASASAPTRAARGALWLSAGSWGAKVTQTVVLLVLAKALAPA